LTKELSPSLGLVLAPCLLEQTLETAGIGLTGVEPEQIPGRPRLDQIMSEELAQRGDVAMERRERRSRRITAPERVDDPVARHDLVGMQKQQRQQRPLLRTWRREIATIGHDLEPAEDSEFHQADCGRRRVGVTGCVSGALAVGECRVSGLAQARADGAARPIGR
jgi:hypothetical protein